MKLHLANFANQYIFTGYGDGYILINQVRYEKSLIVLPDHLIENWPVISVESSRDYMSKRQAPSINAAVPVHTPLSPNKSLTNWLGRVNRKREQGQLGNPHQPLERGKLDRLHSFSQPSHFLLNPCLRLLDAHLLAIRLLSDSALFQIQVQSHRCLGSRDFVAESTGELG